MRSLEALAETRDPRQLALAVLVREMGRSLRDLAPLLPASDDIWLRAFKSRMHNPLPPAVAHDVPDWLWDRLGDAYGDDNALAARARVARARAVRPARQPDEDDARRGARGARWPRTCKRRRRPTRRSAFACTAGLRSTRGSATGASRCRTKAASSSASRSRRKRNEMVVDFCAGAGGKTLLLGALMRSHGRLYAFDVSEARLAKLTPRLARSGLSNVHPQVLQSERDTEGQAPRRQGRPRARRRAVHGIRHAAPQPRPQVAAARVGRRRAARATAARSSRRRRRS